MPVQERRSQAEILELLLGADGTTVFASPAKRFAVWEQVQREISEEFAARWYAAQAEPKRFCAIAEQYCRDVLAGAIPAARLVKAACERHLNDLAKARSGEGPYDFDEAKADRACRFQELLPHTKGRWASRGERMVLSPWQAFLVCCLFGWVHRESRLRRFSIAYLEVSRKNGKSQLAAGIGLYMLAADGEHGAEIYSGATSEKQAYEVFRPATKMVESSPEMAMVLGLSVGAKRISVAADGSRFEPVVRQPGDGSSPHCAIVDEYHEHDTDGLFDAMRTGMGAREQPILLVITTAGTSLAGPCKGLHADVEKILTGLLPGDDTFGIIYSTDPEDDWTSEVALAKANPNMGVSVFREFLLAEQSAAVAKPRKQGIFRTKHLCVWVGANMAYFDTLAWKKLGDPIFRIESFAGLPCFAAVDLSGKKDFTARVLVFRKVKDGKDHYYVFPRFYLPAARVRAPENQQYQDWATEKYLIETEGDVIDFEQVTRETAEDIHTYRVKDLAYDPWNAEQMAQTIESSVKVNLEPTPQNAARLSPPMKELDALIAAGRIHHDGNPVLAWMMGNVVAHEDANENVLPRKEGEENKIDGAVALIMAIARASLQPPPVRSVYATRGVRVL